MARGFGISARTALAFATACIVAAAQPGVAAGTEAKWISNSGGVAFEAAGDGLLHFAVPNEPFYVFGKQRHEVRPGKTYVVKGRFSAQAAFGVQMFDADGKVINGSTSQEVTDTFTTLSAPVAKGDRSIRIRDGLYWRKGGVAWGAERDGSDFPNRNILGSLAAPATNTAAGDWIAPLANAARANLPAGAGVRLQPGGPAYFFANGHEVANGWHYYEGRFSLSAGAGATQLYPGTASFRLVAYAGLGKETSMDWGNATVEEVEDAPEVADPPPPDAGPPLAEPPDYRCPSLSRVEFLERPAHPDLKLVEDGRLRFAVVAARRAEEAFRSPDGLPLQAGQKSVSRAAKLLCDGIRKACGRTPAVLEPDDPEIARWPYLVLVGKSPLTDKLGMDPYALPREGFEVRTFDKGVALAGMDGFRVPGLYGPFDFKTPRISCNGTLWAVQDFLERFLGQRHYYGYEGESIPKLAADFSVRPVAYRDAPQYWCRGYNLAGHPAFRSASSSRFFGGESPHPFAMIKAFPDMTNDLFATDAKGVLQCNPKEYGRNFFDITNPAFAETLAGAFRRYYESNGEYNPLWGGTYIPNGEWCWFGQCDRGGEIRNPRTDHLIETNVDKDNHLTETNYPASARMSSVYAEFFDRFGRLMEDAAPRVKVSCEVYSDYLFPPTKWDRPLPRNVRIMVCYGTPPLVVNEGFRAAYRRVFEGWGRLTADKVVPYIYSAGWSFGAGIQLSLQGWYMGDFLREYADVIDNRRAYACLCGWTKDYFYAMTLCARAMWDPSFDKAAVMDEMWTRLYPPAAAKPLKAFHDAVIETWETKTMPNNPDTYYSSLAGPRYANLHATFDKDWMLRGLGLLHEARRSVMPGTAEGARVERFAKPWTALFVARLDGVKQRMVTDIRPNLVPPERISNGTFRWSEYAWDRCDFLDPDSGFIGLAPRPAKPNRYADEWYRHGAEVTIGLEKAKPGKEPGMSRDGKRHLVADIGGAPATFSFDAKTARHPMADSGIPPAQAIAAIYLNGAEIARETIPEGDWKRVVVELPAGSLIVSSKPGEENRVSVSNLAVSATATLPVSWLLLRRPQLEVNMP